MRASRSASRSPWRVRGLTPSRTPCHDPAALVSNVLSFAVGNAVPTLSSITPSQVWADHVNNDITLAVNGGNFVTGAHIWLGTADRAGTSFVSALQLSAPPTARLKPRITEPANLSPTSQVVPAVVSAGGKTMGANSLNGVPIDAQQTYSFEVSFKTGSCKWTVSATDLAGNTQANICSNSCKVK